MNPDQHSPAVPAKTAHYYVDESGDGVLFGAKGRSLLAADAVNKHFILGMLHVEQPDSLASQLEALRAELLADPYFKNVPSMHAEGRKTALMFHAKDDVPEVRREVYRLLLRHPIRFYAVVRDMHSVLAYELERRRIDPTHRYRPDGLYDSTVARLFKERLHRYGQCNICYAKRNHSDRTDAFTQALSLAKSRFENKWQVQVATKLRVAVSTPANTPCLQAADYMLWALQRYYRLGESRFIETMWDKVGLIHAVDEVDLAPYGNYYGKKKPLPAIAGAAS